MQIHVEETTTYTLTLTRAEAEWLRGTMQNPLHGQHPAEEAPTDAANRRAFFEALTAALPRG